MNFRLLRESHRSGASEVIVITALIAKKLHELAGNVKGNLYYLIYVNFYIRVGVLFYNALYVSGI